MPEVSLGKFIDKADHLRKEGSSFDFIRHIPQFHDGRTGRFLVIAVAKAFDGVLADSFLGGFMMSHIDTFIKKQGAKVVFFFEILSFLQSF
jgi:hypothetical protein